MFVYDRLSDPAEAKTDGSFLNTIFEFQFGVEGGAIPCWQEALKGLCVGAQVELVCPPFLAFGDAGGMHGKVPPGATLMYRITIAYADATSRKAPARPKDNQFAEADSNNNGELSWFEISKWFKWNKSDQNRIHVPIDEEELRVNVNAYFSQMDRDRNAKISWGEFGGTKGEIPRWVGKPEL